MDRIAAGMLGLAMGLSAATARSEGADTPVAPAEQFQALQKAFNDVAFAYRAASDEERAASADAVAELRRQCLDLAERHPSDPIALDALTQVVLQEIFLENNTLHPGEGPDCPGARAAAILLRDHLASERLADPCRRMCYGFRAEYETFLRAVLEKSPHADIRGAACLRLAQYLGNRSHKLDLLREQPEMAARYAGLFGQEFLEGLLRRDRDEAVAELEGLFERAAAEFGDVELPYKETVRQIAETELFALRNLAVGHEIPDVSGSDQDGVPFKLSDYRGRIVLLYFWSEY